MRKWFKKIAKKFTLSAASLMVAVMPVAPALAAVSVPAPAAQVSFTFDDGLASSLTQAAPVLKANNIPGTNYVSTKCIGTTGTCNANTAAKYMTWTQVKKLQNTYGWEIGAHTRNHIPLTTVSDAQKELEIGGSKSDLAAQGINAVSFAYPEGDYDMKTMAIAAKYFSNQRGFWDQGTNQWPHNDHLIRVVQVQAGVTVAQVKASIDQAIADKQWVVLVFHDIKVNASTNPDDYEYKTADLTKIAQYVKTKQTAGLIKATKVKDSVVTSDTNLLANSTFNNGIADGWTTDTPTAVQVDTASKGSFPSATNSIKFTPGDTTAHLFSPKVTVNSSNTYLLKNFINVEKITSGELGFYIDEYDAAGNWVSGQWKRGETSVFVENFNFAYQPTSAAVSQASLQIYATANSGMTAYLDNVQWFPLTNVVPPAPTNLVTNGTFDNGIADGWTTNTAANVAKDSANNGSPANQLNSIKFAATTNNIHLFSPRVAVSSTKAYSLATYVNIAQRTSGELGFYIDEYDAAGNWVSGQWKAERTVGASDLTFNYKPSSAAVATASLQIYVTADSGIVAYADHVRWYAQ